MKQHNCSKEGCENFGGYARKCGHWEDHETEQKDRMKEYMKIRAQFLKDNPKCKFEGCTKDSKDVHHMAGRVGGLLFDTSLYLPLCRGHHLYIESHPVFAKENGYSVSRLKKKETVKTDA